MNLRKLKIVGSEKYAVRIACSRYTDLDDIVIKQATAMGMPLIGGTALELWAKATNTPGVRKRSDNDLDFMASSLGEVAGYNEWVGENVDVSKVKTDVMLVRSHDYTPWEVVVDGVLTMKPEYLLWSKLTRGSEKDKNDIKWILSIKSLRDEDIQNILDKLGLTQKEADLLQECLNEIETSE